MGELRPVNVRLLAVIATVMWFGLPRQAAADKICAFAIPVEMVDKIDSKTARSGGEFRFKVAQTMTLSDGTVVNKGTLGYGVIRSVSAAGRHAHDGSLTIEPRYLMVHTKEDTYDHVDVTMTPTLPVMWTPSEPLINKAASHVPLPVPGLAMTAINTVRWGRNITLGPGFMFSVLPVGNLARGPVC
jgi:hypothetical protein